MADELSERYRDLLDGGYDCVDRIVLNAYNALCSSAGGFRHWWRCLMGGSDDQLDNAHLMRMAGRFSRRCVAMPKLTTSRSLIAVQASTSTSLLRSTWPPTRSNGDCS